MIKRMISAVPLGLAASIAWAGGGYNGPVTAGEAIPVALDRAVNLDRLSATVQTCDRELAGDIARQVLKLVPSEFESYRKLQDIDNDRIDKWNFESDPFFGHLVYGLASVFYKESSSRIVRIKFMDSNRFNATKSTFHRTLHSLRVYFAEDPNLHSTTADYKPVDMPVISFNDKLQEAKYDELGNMDQATFLVDGLTLTPPKSYKDSVPLVNEQSGQPSPIRINMRAYLDCFFDEIQK
jgi:hypothetical protein